MKEQSDEEIGAVDPKELNRYLSRRPRIYIKHINLLRVLSRLALPFLFLEATNLVTLILALLHLVLGYVTCFNMLWFSSRPSIILVSLNAVSLIHVRKSTTFHSIA
jgi:hypothetical protein